MNGNVAQDRDALYYPYIHIKDVNWLKATLLCFPNVRRMIPIDYVPDDADEIKEFCDLAGPRGQPLLTRVDLFGPAAVQSETVLLQKLQQNDATIRSQYSKRRTIEQYGASADDFRVHDEKVIDCLYDYLTDGGEDAL